MSQATLERPGGGSPKQVRPAQPPPSPLLVGGIVGAVAVTVVAGWAIDFSLAPVIEKWPMLTMILGEVAHPDWAEITDPSSRLWTALTETAAIAVIATFVGSLIALGVALLGSKVSAPPLVYRFVKGAMSVIRSLPDMAYALVFVAVVTGALSGILALTIFNIGVVAKLTAESIDAVDPGPLEALDAAGATRWQRARVAIVPAVLPNYASYVIYVFELNIRASAVLGIVGAGGIGQLISFYFLDGDYPKLASVVIVIFVLVVAIDMISQFVRRRLV
ncbi:phosphonate ABC transporter, permease protein PhnE [Nocardioides sp. NPDC047086]|uniref:phosphonate ABC transporter, permease protein PhnE n=1 Tax=Nocardioides sp. NPDC047086 TaxID=3154810 RepID=UPI0033EF4DCE